MLGIVLQMFAKIVILEMYHVCCYIFIASTGGQRLGSSTLDVMSFTSGIAVRHSAVRRMLPIRNLCPRPHSNLDHYGFCQINM